MNTNLYKHNVSNNCSARDLGYTDTDHVIAANATVVNRDIRKIVTRYMFLCTLLMTFIQVGVAHGETKISIESNPSDYCLVTERDNRTTITDCGSIVAASEDTIVVGDPKNNSAYVFHKFDCAWRLTHKLTPQCGGGKCSYDAKFGASVAVNGNMIVIGAPKGVSYEDANGNLVYGGNAYVFHNKSGQIEPEAELPRDISSTVDLNGKPSTVDLKGELSTVDLKGGDQFGVSVAVDGDIVVVGAYHHDRNQKETEATKTIADCGAAYVFRKKYAKDDTKQDAKDETYWDAQELLPEELPNKEDWFGHSVAVDHKTIVVGAHGSNDKSGAVYDKSGAVYVFHEGRNKEWIQKDPILLAEHESFGYSIALDGKTLVVGAEGRDKAGAAYAYQQEDNGEWTLAETSIDKNKLSPPEEGNAGNYKPWSVATDGKTILVASRGKKDRSGGVVYACHDHDGTWTQCKNVVYNAQNNLLGDSVAVAGDTKVFGFSSDDKSMVVIDDPDQHDADKDGVGDACDVCPDVSDPGQHDADKDGFGDFCDVCPDISDPRQEDADGDGFGDACDVCPSLNDPQQHDADGDGFGDACDVCPDVSDPRQEDANRDGIGDACNVPPGPNDPEQHDADKDGVGDAHDVCPDVSDPGQEDADGDQCGDACDVSPYVPHPDHCNYYGCSVAIGRTSSSAGTVLLTVLVLGVLRRRWRSRAAAR